MARGITEIDVHTAADEIVAAGDRPTVERIRAHLGTGSPNTVTRWLETWWQKLSERLAAQHRSITLPEAPEAVATLAGEWWTLALQHAHATALEALAADRATLQVGREALRQEREALAAETAALRGQVDSAVHAERLASTQAAELQRLVSQLERRVEEMAFDRDAAIARVAEATAARQALDARIHELQEAARSERESLSQHVRAVEERAHAEVDRARQEIKGLQGQLASATRQVRVVETSLRELIEQANSKAVEATREAGAQRARAEALEGQLGALRDLPAALEAVMRRADAQPAPHMSRSKRGALSQGRAPKPRTPVKPR